MAAQLTAQQLAELAPPFLLGQQCSGVDPHGTNGRPNRGRSLWRLSRQNDAPLTRYLDRTDPIIARLLSESTLSGSVNKVLDSASRDHSLILIKQKIISKGVEIGTLVMGLTAANWKRKSNKYNPDSMPWWKTPANRYRKLSRERRSKLPEHYRAPTSESK